MIKTIIVIIVAVLLFLLFWKLLKNFIKALIIVAVLLLLFSGVIFIRDYTIIRSITSSDKLIVLEKDSIPVIAIQNKDVTMDFKTPYIALDIDKIDFEYTGNELIEMLNSSNSDLKNEAINVIDSALSNNIMFFIDKKVITIKPEPYFMSMLKGTFRQRIKDDINTVGGAIKSKTSETFKNIRNDSNISLN